MKHTEDVDVSINDEYSKYLETIDSVVFQVLVPSLLPPLEPIFRAQNHHTSLLFLIIKLPNTEDRMPDSTASQVSGGTISLAAPPGMKGTEYEAVWKT